MIFSPTPIDGAFVVDIEQRQDERGFFARTFSTEEFTASGLNAAVVQCSVSFNVRKATLRGMHYQRAPHGETKLVRCTMGAVWDAIVDLRRDSPSYRHWFGIELSAENRRALYIPEGVAHGFITLTDGSEVFYQIGSPYVPDAGAGVLWDDPAFGIEWPIAPAVMNDRDRQWPAWPQP